MGERICSVDGCERPHEARGWCRMHYRRWAAHGDPGPAEKLKRRGEPPTPCSVEDCGRLARIKGFCFRHYNNQRRNNGDPLPRTEKSLWRRLEEVGWDVTDSGCWEWRGNRNASGYGRITYRGEYLIASRAMLALHSPPGTGDLVTRHKCDNPPCVNPDHLEWGTHEDNMRDASERGRTTSFKNGSWGGRCKSGRHDVTSPEAVIVRADGCLLCRECDQERRSP